MSVTPIVVSAGVCAGIDWALEDHAFFIMNPDGEVGSRFTFEHTAAGLKRLVKATVGLATYIENNIGAIPDYSERWHNSERISTAFAESTVNAVISRRFAKKQQMQWSKQGAHLLLQTRTRTLDGTLHDLFTRWYPTMAANNNEIAIPAAA